MTNADTITGTIKKTAGKAEALAGEVLDDPEMELRGDLHEVDGSVHELIGQIQDTVYDAADQLTAAATRVGETARTVYADITIRAQDVANRVDPFVKAKPYAALGLAAAGGPLLGMLYANRGPKVVLIKTHH